MAIERAIYGSFIKGIEQDNAIQFFSYTPGIKLLIDKKDPIISFMETNYSPPENTEWMVDHPDQDIRNDMESNHMRKFHPANFSYSKRMVDGKEKYVFSFGKTMGRDWTNVRPNAKYIYTAICDKEDIKRSPVFYGSSPAIACDIPRRAPFSEKITHKDAPRPAMLQTLSDMDTTENIVDLEHYAGFKKIGLGDIIDFLGSANRLDIFRSMLEALMRHKDNAENPAILIADDKDNLIYWIAALSNIFPFPNTLDLSFASYTYKYTGEYDITGAYIPEKYSFCLEGKNEILSNTDYSYEKTQAIAAVYDFEKNAFANSGSFSSDPFMDMIEQAMNGDISSLSEYKDYITENTTYSGLNSDYRRGYSLFRYMTKKDKPDNDRFAEAIEFAKKYASPAEKKRLLDKLLLSCKQVIDDERAVSAIQSFFTHCIDAGLERKERIYDYFISDVIDCFNNEHSAYTEYNSISKTAMKFCSMDEVKLNLYIAQKIGLPAMAGMADKLKDKWHLIKLLYLMFSMVSNGKSSGENALKSGSPEYTIANKTIVKLIENDSAESIKQLKSILTEAEACLGDMKNVVRYLNAICFAFAAVRNNSAIQIILDFMMQNYVPTLTKNDSSLLKIISDLQGTDRYFGYILKELENLPTLQMLDTLKFIVQNADSSYHKYANNVADAAINKASTEQKGQSGSAALVLNGKLFELLTLCISRWNATLRDNNAILHTILTDYTSGLSDIGNSFISKEQFETLHEMKSAVERMKAGNLPEAVTMFISMYEMKENAGKENSGIFSGKSREPIADISLLASKDKKLLMDAIAQICAERWLAFTDYQNFECLVKISNTQETGFVHQTILRSTLQYALKGGKAKARATVAAQIIVLALKKPSCTSVLSDVPEMLHNAGVKSGEIIKAIEHDEEEYINNLMERLDNANDFNEAQAVAALNKQKQEIDEYYKNHSSNSGFGGFFQNLFSGKKDGKDKKDDKKKK